MSHEQTAKQLTNALPSGKRPRERPRTCWRDYTEDLAWSRLGIPLELEDPNSSCCLRHTIKQEGKEKYTEPIYCFLQK